MASPNLRCFLHIFYQKKQAHRFIRLDPVFCPTAWGSRRPPSGSSWTISPASTASLRSNATSFSPTHRPSIRVLIRVWSQLGFVTTKEPHSSHYLLLGFPDPLTGTGSVLGLSKSKNLWPQTKARWFLFEMLAHAPAEHPFMTHLLSALALTQI